MRKWQSHKIVEAEPNAFELGAAARRAGPEVKY